MTGNAFSIGYGEQVQYYLSQCGTVGWKLYHYQSEMLQARDYQIQAAHNNLGPYVYGSGEVYWNDSIYSYFYLTEHVRLPEWEEYCKWQDWLEEQFEKVFGRECDDLHEGNMGMRGNTPLVIDFGYHSFA